MGIIAAEFPADVVPMLTVTSRITTKNFAVNLSALGTAPKEDQAELKHFLRPTKLMPTDGFVKTTATEITKNSKTDVEKARAIYEWIVDNTFRNPKTRGCGLGDIRFMLETKDLGGKCADLNALYVGLARAAGLPARDVYGIRTAKSEMGYKSLGPSSEIVTKAQHCRAEVYLSGYGWVPVDPADVRKVVLEEPPGNRPLDDDMVKKARARLFGSWEMNWMAYNFAHDVDSARIEWYVDRIFHVSTGRDTRWATRLPRSGRLQVRDQVEGDRVYKRLTELDVELPFVPESPGVSSRIRKLTVNGVPESRVANTRNHSIVLPAVHPDNR